MVATIYESLNSVPDIPFKVVYGLLGLYCVLSLITFVAMWRDKRAAAAGGPRPQRTPESSLHLLALLGGWPGTLLAQRMLRHKNRKQRFKLILTGIIALHVLAWIAALYLQWS